MQFDDPILFLATARADQSRSFYEEVVGLEWVADEPFALVFRSGKSMLRIQKVENVHIAPYTALGWNVPDIRKAMDELQGRGAIFERYDQLEQDKDGIWRTPNGTLIAWFKDPDGNLLSITSFPDSGKE
jgi:catechol 2,3-dioxygenase-like lactoylglutathione lyase family enzyme